MREFQSLSHTKWDCKYHIVFIPKYRKKKLYGKIRKHLGSFFHELAKYKESKIIEGHICPDHVHMCISIPPKYAVSNVIGYIKGKSAISIARNLMGLKRNFTGQAFWARGYFKYYSIQLSSACTYSSNLLTGNLQYDWCRLEL
jgi:putative transposase